MSDKKPYWFHCTVPHSGTRYINNTFERSGYSVNACLPWEKREELGIDLGWGHTHAFAHPSRPHIYDCVREADVKWQTVRDPIMTMKTHWGTNDEEPYVPQRQLNTELRLDRLKQCYEQQIKVFDLFGGRAYRVDRDDLSLLEEWTGATLDPGDRESHNSQTHMAYACEAANVDLIEQLTADTDWWPRWKYEITPIFKDLYEDLGYDIWWI